MVTEKFDVTFEDWVKKEKDIQSLEGKSAESLTELYNEYNAHWRKQIRESIEAKASKDDIYELYSKFETEKDKQFEKINEILKAQGVVLKKLTIQEKEDDAQTFSQLIRKGLEDNFEKLKASKEGSINEAKENAFSLDIKAPATMTLANNVSGGNIPVEDRIEGFNIIPSRQVRLLDIMSQRSTTSNVVSWVYQANKDGSAGQTAEAAAKNQIDFDLVVGQDAPKKTTAYIKVSTEMLDDITWIQSEIENELMREITKAVETQAYSGDGTGQNHAGIRTVASAFSAGSFALSVDNANEIDVLTVAMNQIAVAQEGSATANYILMHPDDVTALKLVKVSTTDKRYVERLWTVGSTLILDGVPIIPTTLVTQGDYLVGDFGLSILVTRTGMRFDIGLDGNDFTNNLRTILGEWRGLTIVKNNDRTAFVAGDFTTDKAALETP